MSCLGRRLYRLSNAPTSSGACSGRAGHCSLIMLMAAASFFAAAGVAHSGPCTAQIAQLEQQVSATSPGPETGPTGPQTLGAQLHYQPTPADVAHAERIANKDAAAALAHARKADAAGDVAGCNAALKEAKRLYDIDQ
jgi:hypothetical protein